MEITYNFYISSDIPSAVEVASGVAIVFVSESPFFSSGFPEKFRLQES